MHGIPYDELIEFEPITTMHNNALFCVVYHNSVPSAYQISQLFPVPSCKTVFILAPFAGYYEMTLFALGDNPAVHTNLGITVNGLVKCMALTPNGIGWGTGTLQNLRSMFKQPWS